MGKRGSNLQQTIVHIILVALILALLVFAVLGRGNNSEIKKELLEKQTAMLIEASPQNTQLEINKQNVNGLIKNVEIKDYRISIDVGSVESEKGYMFFSKYDVSVKEEETKFIIKIE